MKRRNPIHNQAGVTLIELMVSLVLAAMLVGGLFYMMSGQKRTYSSQMDVMAAQQNLWGSMEYLQSQVRLAGYGFGTCGGEIRMYNSATGLPTSLQGLEIHNNHNLYTGSSDGTDSFSIRHSNRTGGGGWGARITKQMPASSANIFTNQTGLIQNGDFMVLCEPGSNKWATLYQATAAPAMSGGDHDGDGNNDYKIEHNPSTSTYNPPGGKNIAPPGGYKEGAVVIRFGSNIDPRHFAIDRTKNPPMMVTWTTSTMSDMEVIAEGIEDMQIAWACDVNGDGVFSEGACVDTTSDGICQCSDDNCVDRRDVTKDEWANNVASDNLPPCGTNRIGVVRITLVARSAGPVQEDKNGYRPEAEDHYKGSTGDDLSATGHLGTYQRAVLTTKVKPRNIR